MEQNHLAHLDQIKKLHDTEIPKQRKETQTLLDVNEKLLEIPGDLDHPRRLLDDMSERIKEKDVILEGYPGLGLAVLSMEVFNFFLIRSNSASRGGC